MKMCSVLDNISLHRQSSTSRMSSLLALCLKDKHFVLPLAFEPHTFSNNTLRVILCSIHFHLRTKQGRLKASIQLKMCQSLGGESGGTAETQ